VKLIGTCACGTVRYSVPDEFRYAANCHCSVCRRATGSAFKPFAGIERDKFEVVDGEDSLMKVGGDVDWDARCKACGSYLFSVVRDGRWIHVSMGTLVDTPSIRASEHLFVGSKAAWFTITDDLPQRDGFS
jgi:hypothetical protein